MKKESIIIEPESFIKEISRSNYEDNFLGDPDAIQTAFTKMFDQRGMELDVYCKRTSKNFSDDSIIDPVFTCKIYNISYHSKYLTDKEVWRIQSDFEVEFKTEWTEKKKD